MADTLITPSAGGLSGVGYVVRAITIGLVLNGFVPTVHSSINDMTRAPTVGGLTIAGVAPDITNSNLSATRTPTTGSLTLTGQTPTIPLTNVSLAPGVGLLSLVRETFPTTPVLDSFDRANENPLNTNWDVLKLGQSECRVVSNVVRAPSAAVGYSYWASNNFGPNTEVYATVVKRPVPGEQIAFYVRLASPNSAAMQGYKVAFQRSATAFQCTIKIIRLTGNNEIILLTHTDAEIWADNDQIGCSCIGTQIHVWHRPKDSVWRVIEGLTDTTYPNSGNLGIEISDLTNDGTALDEVGGGTAVQPPDAPSVSQNLGLKLTGYIPILLNTGAIRKDPLVGTLTATGVLATVTSTQPVALIPSAGSLVMTSFLGGVFGGSWVVTPAAANLQLVSTQQIAPSTATELKCQPWNKLDWNANTESDLAGYKVYHGVVSGTYPESVTLGIVTTYVWNNLPYGNNYFVVTAFDTAVPPNESTRSAEVSSFTSGSGFAPTLTNSSPNVKIPATGTLTFSGIAPSIQAYQVPIAGTLAVTGAAPLVGLGIVVPPGNLTFTGANPFGAGTVAGAPGVGVLLLAGAAPTVLEQGTFTILPSTGSLILTGAAPTVPAAWQASLATNANQVLDAGGSPLDA